MTTNSTRPGRIARWAALLAAVLAGGGMLAAPAAAQDSLPIYAYTHGDVSAEGVEPGDTAEITPTFFQEEPLPEDVAAVIIVFYESIGSGVVRSDIAVTVPYDNCYTSSMYSVGPHCVITDFEDFAGSPVTLTRPALYEVSPRTPGPVDICNCHYAVFAVDAERFEDHYNPPDWDPNSENLIDLQAADSWDGPSSGEYPEEQGLITIETTEHPYDLALEDLMFEGAEGDEVSATLPVVNLGPASSLWTDDLNSSGSISVRGRLPAGLELVGFEFADSQIPLWTCLSEEADIAAEFDRIAEETGLERLDFACFTLPIEAEEVREGLQVTVRITDADALAGGMIETGAVPEPDGWPENLPELESTLENNRADIVVDVEDAAAPAPQLPETGTSTAVPLLAATAALVVGTALFVLARRRGIAE